MLGADATPQANMRAVIGGALPIEGSGEHSRSAQAMAHAALSSAYLVMQLPVDALFTAAKAIEFCIDAATAVALRVLFDARLMRPGAEQSLRDQLFPH